jgi:DEAD/DEAH box helicase domain-containing protein
LEGEQYVVEDMDYENRKAYVRESDSDYYTDAISHTKISVLSQFDESKRNNFLYAYGETHVFTQVVGFKKIKFFTNEIISNAHLLGAGSWCKERHLSSPV